MAYMIQIDTYIFKGSNVQLIVLRGGGGWGRGKGVDMEYENQNI